MTRVASVAVPSRRLTCSRTGCRRTSRRRPWGARVLVPIGSRTITGCVTGTDEWRTGPAPSADGLRTSSTCSTASPTCRLMSCRSPGGWRVLRLRSGEVIAAAAPPMTWMEAGASSPSPRPACARRRRERRPVSAPGPARARDCGGGPELPESTLRTRLERAVAGRAGRARRWRTCSARSSGHGLVSVTRCSRRGRRLQDERVIELTAQDATWPAAPTRPACGWEAASASCSRRSRPHPPASRRPHCGTRIRRRRASARRPQGSRQHPAPPVERDPFAGPWGRTSEAGARVLEVTLTAEQEAALDRLRGRLDTAAFRVALVRGVTAAADRDLRELAEQVMRAGRRALVLVPEIALTPGVAAGVPGAVRRARGHPAQRPLRRRAPRPVAAHPARRRRRGRRTRSAALRRCRTSASSSSTRSTTRRPSRTRARATTAATWPSCAGASSGPWSSSGRPRRRWSRTRTPRAAATNC